MYDKIIESCNYVMDNSYYVNINYNKLDKFISKINTKDLKNWILNNPYNLLDLDIETIINFLLVFETIDYSFWGNKFIDELAIELKISFPNIKGFSVRNLKNMKKYYIECQKSQFVQTASTQIPWSHNILILDKIKDEEKRIWYMI